MIRREAKIFFGANGWTFTQPGEYTLKAVYMKGVESNEWPFSIMTPCSDSEKKMVDLFLGSKEVGYFLLFEGGDHLVEGKKRLEEVAAQFYKSNFGTYANFVLGANLMKDFANFKENRLRKADPKLAIDYFEKSRFRSSGFHHGNFIPFSFHEAVYTHIYLEEACRQLGQPERANTVREELQTSVEQKMDEIYHDFREYKDFMKDILQQREKNKK